jgi:hypothetical protein
MPVPAVQTLITFTLSILISKTSSNLFSKSSGPLSSRYTIQILTRCIFTRTALPSSPSKNHPSAIS